MFSLILTLSSVLCSDTLLERMPGALSQIETDPDYHLVCGVNSIHQAFCSSTAPVEWYELPGKLKQITVASGSLFGVNVDNKIFYSPSAENGKVGFTPIDGSLSQVSFDGKTLCGTNSAFDVYCATENLSTNPTWVQLPGALSQVVVRGETLYGVNSINQIFYSPSVTKPVWTQLPGTLKQIQFDGNVLCGTNAEDIIYCATSLLTTNPDWTPIPGKLSAISVGGGGQLFGVNSGQQIFSGLYIPPPPPSCTSNADCSSGLVCLNPGAAGVCGNTDPEHQEVLTVQSVGQAVAKGRKLITDNDAWTKGDSVPTKVVMAHLLAPLANDAYKPVPSSVLGDWNALTPAIGGDTSHNIMKSWAWLSMTVYGNITTNRYVIAFKGTNPSRINEVLTDLYATKSSCKLQNEDCGDVHAGFYQAYGALKRQLVDVLISLQLSESAEIYVTGHSLGGAIATICAFDLATRGLNLRGVVTFGSPRLGNSEFETLYHNLISKKGIPSSRFVAIDKGQTHQDAVTMVPPLTLTGYSRPFTNVIVGISPACDSWTIANLFACEISLHDMTASYIPMVQALYTTALKKLS